MDVTVAEFPFVADLPKREVRAVKTLWDEFRELAEVVKKRGAMVTPSAAAELLGISRQRVDELIRLGRFDVVVFRGVRMVCEDDIIRYAEDERKAGRPWTGPKSTKEALQRALKVGKLLRDSRR